MFNWLTSRLFPVWVPIYITRVYTDLSRPKETFLHSKITFLNLKNSATKIEEKLPYENYLSLSGYVESLIHNNKDFFYTSAAAQNYLKKYYSDLYKVHFSGIF